MVYLETLDLRDRQELKVKREMLEDMASWVPMATEATMVYLVFAEHLEFR